MWSNVKTRPIKTEQQSPFHVPTARVKYFLPTIHFSLSPRCLCPWHTTQSSFHPTWEKSSTALTESTLVIASYLLSNWLPTHSARSPVQTYNSMALSSAHCPAGCTLESTTSCTSPFPTFTYAFLTSSGQVLHEGRLRAVCVHTQRYTCEHGRCGFRISSLRPQHSPRPHSWHHVPGPQSKPSLVNEFHSYLFA